MRKVAVGLLGLSLTATGLAVVPSATAAPQPKLPTSAPSVAEPAHTDHDLPNPLEEKRRALRQEGLSEVLSGKAKVQRINGSTAPLSRSASPDPLSRRTRRYPAMPGQATCPGIALFPRRLPAWRTGAVPEAEAGPDAETRPDAEARAGREPGAAPARPIPRARPEP